jgi:hypothetical protein
MQVTGQWEMAEPPKPTKPSRHRPLHLLDLMAMVAAVALTLVSPAIMKAIIPADAHHNWDRRQYLAHLAALVMIWWTVTLVPLVLFGNGRGLRRIIRGYGCAAILAAATTALFLVLRQAPAVMLLATGAGSSPMGLFKPRLFDILEHAPDASAASVVAVWTILALTGTGRRPSNWFERLGCLVGWTWIVMGFLSLIIWIVSIPRVMRSGIPW